jgi:hypothetical protein
LNAVDDPIIATTVARKKVEGYPSNSRIPLAYSTKYP